ncbi:MAG: AAA family ATPase [Gammaproteobacteria bacterium]|nr:AAA family ATPase [Gammaproteobacteria bacterium]
MHLALKAIISQVGEVVLGADRSIKLAIACLLAKGHLLIEDLPGVGKTTLGQALSKALGLDFHRVQFTSDLLPADILGVSVYQRETGSFNFHPGPIFSQLILADEINRATPKTQSALLESMGEGQVTIEGETRLLPEPFFVIATQNPNYQIGTFPLPESQLDRFLMKISIGYLDNAAERILLQGEDRREMLKKLHPRMTTADLIRLQRAVTHVHTSDAILDYIQQILLQSRINPNILVGLSPRAGLAIKNAAQAWALIQERDYVLPEDIQEVLIPVTGHRLRDKDHEPLSDGKLEEMIIRSVTVP